MKPSTASIIRLASVPVALVLLSGCIVSSDRDKDGSSTSRTTVTRTSTTPESVPAEIFDLSETLAATSLSGIDISLTPNVPTPINLTGAGDDLTLTLTAIERSAPTRGSITIETPGPSGLVPYRTVSLGLDEAVLVPGGLLICTGITESGITVQVDVQRLADEAPATTR